MLLLDTHIWVWWVQNALQLSEAQKSLLTQHQKEGLGVSVISCLEVARLVEGEKIALPQPIETWMENALSYPGMQLIPLTAQIAIDSTRLPGDFHRDPADRIIVATARFYDCPLMTQDEKILRYPHVKLA